MIDFREVSLVLAAQDATRSAEELAKLAFDVSDATQNWLNNYLSEHLVSVTVYGNLFSAMFNFFCLLQLFSTCDADGCFLLSAEGFSSILRSLVGSPPAESGKVYAELCPRETPGLDRGKMTSRVRITGKLSSWL